jgi:uncharacterized protein (TIGR00251 family)
VKDPPRRRQNRDLRLELQVQPRAKRDEVSGRHGGRLKLRLTAPPADGKANAALIAFLAGEFGVPKVSVEIIAGRSSRQKTVLIRDPKKHPSWLSDGGEQ